MVLRVASREDLRSRLVVNRPTSGGTETHFSQSLAMPLKDRDKTGPSSVVGAAKENTQLPLLDLRVRARSQTKQKSQTSAPTNHSCRMRSMMYDFGWEAGFGHASTMVVWIADKLEFASHCYMMVCLLCLSPIQLPAPPQRKHMYIEGQHSKSLNSDLTCDQDSIYYPLHTLIPHC